MRRIIWINAVCKSLLSSPMAVKELIKGKTCQKKPIKSVLTGMCEQRYSKRCLYGKLKKLIVVRVRVRVQILNSQSLWAYSMTVIILRSNETTNAQFELLPLDHQKYTKNVLCNVINDTFLFFCIALICIIIKASSRQNLE